MKMGTGAKTYQAPDWINQDFLQEVLREFFKDDKLEVRDMVVKSANASGMASEMHRVTCDLVHRDVTKPFSVILKDHPKGYTGIVAHKSKLFQREIVVYREVLRRVKQLLASIGDMTKIAPACYYTTESPEPFLILEDMTAAGYENFERGRLLNLDHALPTIEKLAKLHACSAVIAAKNPSVLEFFEEAPISSNPNRKDFLGFFPANIRCVAEELSRWKGYEDITAKMFTLSEKVLQRAVDMYASHDQGFRVLNLADLWINNLLFRINTETKDPEDVVMLDYQLCYYGSPAVDLNYFLFGSLNENVRKVHFKYIIREYHRVLTDTLQKLDYKEYIPSLKDLHIELIKNSLQGVVFCLVISGDVFRRNARKQNEFFLTTSLTEINNYLRLKGKLNTNLAGVIAATCLTPLIFMDTEGFDDLESLTARTENGDQIRRHNVENPKYRAFFQRTVKEFEASGFLDS